VADAQVPTGRGEARLPLGASIGQHCLDPTDSAGGVASSPVRSLTLAVCALAWWWRVASRRVLPVRRDFPQRTAAKRGRERESLHRIVTFFVIRATP
jgi:hypothetical protein